MNGVETQFVPGWVVGLMLVLLAMCVVCWAFQSSAEHKVETDEEPEDSDLYRVQMVVMTRNKATGEYEKTGEFEPVEVVGINAVRAEMMRLYSMNRWGNEHAYPHVYFGKVIDDE